MIINTAGTDSLSTVKLFEGIGSTYYGQILIRRVEKEGLFERREGDPRGTG